MKNINKAITVFLLGLYIVTNFQPVFADGFPDDWSVNDYGSWSVNDYGTTNDNWSVNDYGTWSVNDYGTTNDNWSVNDYGTTNDNWSVNDYGSYTSPSYTTTDYTSVGYDYTNYTTPSYVAPTYGYTNYNYTNPTYGYTNYNYTNYTYPTTPVVHNCTYTNNSNVASYNQNYPSCTKVCTNGTTVGANATCPSPTSPCPAGYTRLANGTCGCPAGTVPVMPDGCGPATPTPGNCVYPGYTLTANGCVRQCSNGTYVTYPNTCPNVIPVTPVTICSDGLPPVNGSCIRTNTIPTTVQTICSDGSYPVNGSCTRVITTPSVTYQTCWDGTTIPLYSVCPAQYKTCANGTSIPVNQTCYYGNTYVPYVPPVTIKFNNVITSVATEITNYSARCNGIGLIASNAPSTGWFEYGETPNLGRETAHANIGSSATAPFSNVLTNLKPTTTYYCRAVMLNQFGTVKGEVVAFTTKGKAVSYVAPVTKTTVKTTTTKTTSAKTNEVVCVDGKTVKVQSQSAADLINAGSKLVTLQIEKVSGNLSSGSTVMYKLTLKNASDTALKNMTVKVTIPAEVKLTNASAGTYDPTMHVLTVPNVSLPAYGDAVINWTGTVNADASVGKSTVTTVYANYALPGSQAQDEVTAYVVGTIVPSIDSATTTGSKHVIGASTAGSFLPNSLIEWLALIAILFIIFILGRSVYTSYSNDKKASH